MATDTFFYDNHNKVIKSKLERYNDRNYFVIELSTSERITLSLDDEQLKTLVKSINEQYNKAMID